MKEKCHIFSLVTQLLDEIVDIPSSFLSANHFIFGIEFNDSDDKSYPFLASTIYMFEFKEEKKHKVLMQRENNFNFLHFTFFFSK